MNIEKVKEALEDCAELYVLADGIQSFEDFEGGQPSLGTLKNLQIIKESAIKAKSALAELEKPAPVCKWDLVGFTYWPKCRAENCTDKMSFGKSTIELYKFCPFCGRKIEPNHA